MNTLDKLSEVTGLKKPEMDKIWQEVKENQKLLESCSRHDFTICLDRYTRKPIESPTPQQHFGAKWKCAKCGGWVDGLARSWYNRGIEAAK